ncbi:MAG: OmpH family outer membrane protein [Pirellulales bacterium]|nr:OmpH family outer membrane protein [Pirellulales bacterium]
MTKFKILAAVAAIVLAVGALATDSYAQQNYTGAAAQSQQVHSSVALLDVGYVFKQDSHFNSLKESLKLELQRADAQMKAERDRIIERAKGLKELKIGTPDYKALEAEVAKMQGDLQVKVQLMKKELMTKEAKIYHEVYTEIYQEVEAIAQAYGFVAVIQFNGDRAEPENPEAIMREISKPIVWHNASLDITPEVLKRLSARRGGMANSNSRQGLPAQPPRR